MRNSSLMWVILGLAVWVFISPWVLGYSPYSAAADWCAWLTGIAIAVVAAIGTVYPAQLLEWLIIALSAWLFVSPWLLNYYNMAFIDVPTATVNAMFVSTVMWLLAVWALGLRMSQLEQEKAV